MADKLNKPWQTIQWTKRPQGVMRNLPAFRNVVSFNAAAKSWRDVVSFSWPAPSALRAAVNTLGVPTIPGATPLEEARFLLYAAGEVEHALLVEYLYAAWSLGSDSNATIVLNIAIQEMCHFITVQNLLLFVGSNPSMQRQDQDPSPTLDPFPLTLRPFSRAVLEDFLLTEMPPLDNMTPAQKAVMQPIVNAHASPGTTVNPVGVIYGALYWLFQENDLPTPPWNDVASAGFGPGRHIASFPGTGTAATFQADPFAEPYWLGDSGGHGGVFEKIGSREEALQALFDVASQGEGLVASTAQQSHFSQFLTVYQNTDFNHLPASNWPTDPFVADQPVPDPTREANRITNPVSVSLSQIVDLRYKIALTSIRAALARDRTNAVDATFRAKYVGWLFNEMKGSVKRVSGALARLPLKTAGQIDQTVAAPTFDLGDFTLPDDQAGLETVMLSLHQQCATAITATLAQPVDIGVKGILQAILANDKTRYPNLAAPPPLVA